MILDWRPVSIEPTTEHPVLVRSMDNGGWDYDVAVLLDGEWWQKDMCYRVDGVVEYAELGDRFTPNTPA